MIRNSARLTAIIVATASVISSMPVAAAEKLETKNGTVEKGVAYKDGKYLYQGYRTEDDDTALYYNNGTKDKKLDNADEIDQKYGDKYVSARDGSDYYVIDMSSGKISDEDTIDESEDTAITKLANKLVKTDRYNRERIDFKKKSQSPNASATLERVTGNRFEDEWYSYNVTSSNATTSCQVDKFGYTTESGKYIDCSYDLNLYAYYNPTTSSAASGKMHKIEDVEDKADITNKDGKELKMTVTSLKFVKYLGQDNKYLYSLIKVGIKNGMGIGVPQDKEDGSRVSYYIQKVSKQQGNEKEDAYRPKSTECYELTPDYKNSDVKDAYEAVMKLVPGSSYADNNAKIAIVDNAIYLTFNDSDDKIKTYKLQLKNSQKLDNYSCSNGNWSKDGKIDGRVVTKVSDVDQKVKESDSWTIDSNGVVWAIEGGKVMKSVKGGSFTTVYTCDRSLDALDVYDENNMIIWDKGGDAYTTIQEGTAGSKKAATEVEPPKEEKKTGWDYDKATGIWYLYDAQGNKLTGWQFVGGKWYYMNSEGKMQTGWQALGGKWYYLHPANGDMQTGWQFVGGKWYYMDTVNGDMKSGWQYLGNSWYYLDPTNGDMKTGWVFDGQKWYYMYSNGSMAYSTTIDGYKLSSSGAWIN